MEVQQRYVRDKQEGGVYEKWGGKRKVELTLSVAWSRSSFTTTLFGVDLLLVNSFSLDPPAPNRIQLQVHA